MYILRVFQYDSFDSWVSVALCAGSDVAGDIERVLNANGCSELFRSLESARPAPLGLIAVDSIGLVIPLPNRPRARPEILPNHHTTEVSLLVNILIYIIRRNPSARAWRCLILEVHISLVRIRIRVQIRTGVHGTEDGTDTRAVWSGGVVGWQNSELEGLDVFFSVDRLGVVEREAHVECFDLRFPLHGCVERDGRVGNGGASRCRGSLEENKRSRPVSAVSFILVSGESLLGSHPDVYILDQGVVAVCGGGELGEHSVLL